MEAPSAVKEIRPSAPAASRSSSTAEVQPHGQQPLFGVAEQPGDRVPVAGEGVAGDPAPTLALPLPRHLGRHVEQDQMERATPAHGVPGEPAAYPGLGAAVVHDDGFTGAQGVPEAEVVRGADQGAVEGVGQ